MNIVDVRFQSYKIFLICLIDIDICSHNQKKKIGIDRNHGIYYFFYTFFRQILEKHIDFLFIFIYPLFHLLLGSRGPR